MLNRSELQAQSIPRSSYGKTLRIFLADDHDVVRQGIRAIIEQQSGWTVCGEANNGRDAVIKVAELQPDVAIFDLAMPSLNGFEATRQVHQRTPHTKIIVFTMHQNDLLVRDILRAGARGYVLKSDASEHIVDAIIAVAHGEPYFSGMITQAILDRYLQDVAGREEDWNGPLTRREREIVQLLAEGRSNGNVAAVLEISVKTVETHRAAIMRKLGLGSVADLVRYAVRNNIIEP